MGGGSTIGFSTAGSVPSPANLEKRFAVNCWMRASHIPSLATAFDHAMLPAEKTASEFMLAVNRARQAQGLVLVPVDSALGIPRVIRGGGVLGLLADRAVTGVGAGRMTSATSAEGS